MTRHPEPDLEFARTAPQGFAGIATVQWDGNPEPVIREIVQNALDAAVKAGVDCQVDFSVREVPLNRVPGIDSYRNHFRSAVRERSSGAQGAAEKLIIERIEKVLRDDRARLLYCRDNGIGLTPESMRGLLTEGNTDKERGAGSYGVGHLTAFAASDARYVLYAARSRNGMGPPAEIASGHAILASRTERDSRGVVLNAYGAHGHWVMPGRQLGLFDPTYPDEAPPLLKEELERLEDTGTVVCIIGFNDFRDRRENAVEAIARVAAKNYLVAIWRGEMVVYIGDETKTPQRERIVDDASLHSVLHPHRKQKMTRRGWLPGEQAFRCLRTLQEGEWLSLSCGAKARVRLLDAKEGTSSRVQLFRDGMWIDNRADELGVSSFTGYKPFDAAILIGRRGQPEGAPSEIETLVRNAEGPEHRGLDRRRLSDRAAKQRLLDLLRCIRDELQQWAGKVEDESEHIPDDFAVFTGRGGATASPEPPYRPREPRVPEEEDQGKGREGKSLEPSDEENETVDPLARKSNRRRAGRGASPKPGKSVRGSMAIVAQPGAGGGVDTFSVFWKADAGSENTSSAGRLGIRVRIPSGSDTTCELPLGPRWLRLKEVRAENAPPAHLYDNGMEAALPSAGELRFTVTLRDPLTDVRVIEAMEVDVVRRAQPTPAEALKDERDS